MDRANVEEFYEVYKGVVSEYNVSARRAWSTGAESVCLTSRGLGLTFNRESVP